MFLLKPYLMSISNTNVAIIFMYNMQYFLYGYRCIDWGPLECVLATRSGHNLMEPFPCMLQPPLFGKVINYNCAITYIKRRRGFFL